MFTKELSLTWKELSQHLGFRDDYVIDVDSVMPKFERTQFWKEISDEDVCGHPHTNFIQLPTLHFMHKWLGMTLFPREDTCIVRIEDLKLMFAMIKCRKVSPVQFMIVHWLGIFKQKGKIEYSSLVTRIANKLGLMENSLVEYIPRGWPYITIDYFWQGQMLKGGKILVLS
jgi:hypothetical protein